MDGKAAFFNGDVEEHLFMKLQEGFVSEVFLDHFCHLKKALYGIKQALHQ